MSQTGKLRLIQAGVGGHGRGWMINTVAQSDDFDVVAIADPNPNALGVGGECLGLNASRQFADLAQAVSKVEADAVLSVTPPAVHLEQAQIAFENGLHLLIEKPLAADLASARKMVELSDAADRRLMVGHNRRWDPEPTCLKQVFDSKPFGRFGHGHIDFFLPADFRGSFRQTMPHVLLVDMAVHHIDLIRHVLGRDIKRVYAEDFNPWWSNDRGYYTDGAALRMQMTLDDDTRMSYAGDWSAKGVSSGWQGAWRLQCANGAISYSDDLGGVELASCGMWGKDTRRTVRPIPKQPPSQARLLEAFANSIRTKKPGLTSGRDNLKTIAAVFAAVESCETGRAVDVSL